MAEPGDPPPPSDDEHDDLIGFTSPASLVHARRTPEPSHQAPAVAEDDPEQAGLFDPPINRVAALRARHAPASPSPGPPLRHRRQGHAYREPEAAGPHRLIR